MNDKFKYPNWVEGETDKELMEEFYVDLVQKYPQLAKEVEQNEGLLHIDMGALRRLAEEFCEQRRLNDAKDCFEWLNTYFCRSKNELLNAINVSFLEYFDFRKGLSEEEFKNLMPPTLYRCYLEMIEYMENLAKKYKELTEKEKPEK